MAVLPVALTDAPDVSRALPRPRLVNLIADPDHIVTVVVGAEGSGKSTAAKQAADARAVRSVWVRLAPGCGGVADLVALVRRSVAPDAANGSEAGLDRGTAAPRLAELLDGPATTLVVDDHQFGDADAIDPVLAEVASLLDPQSKIVVCSTRRPSGLIGRLHGADRAKVAVIDQDQLAFTEAEQDALDAAGPAPAAKRPSDDDDPTTAIEHALGQGDVDRALALLRAHLDAIGPFRAVRWLFRVPAARRDELPPEILAAAQAEADDDRMVFDARRRIDEAVSDRARSDAIFALGAVLARRGALGAAAAAFEDAITATPPDADAARPTTWVGIVRWWAGDLEGSRQDLRGATDALGRWARVEVELAAEELRAAAVLAAPPPPGTDAAGDPDPPSILGVRARVAWAQGDVPTAAELARAAYEQARPVGGFDLTAAAMTYLWMMLDAGEIDEVLEISDFLDRRIGRQDLFTRTNVALLQLAAARLRGDERGTERAARRLAECRAFGFGPIEAEARRRLPVLVADGAPIEVGVLGPTTVRVAGAELDVTGWPPPVLEVLLYLSLVEGRRATRNAIIAAVWPEHDVDEGRAALRRALAHIRGALEPLRPLGEPSSYLGTERQHVRLFAVTDYEEARSQAERGDPASALALFRGELLEDVAFLDWASSLRRAASSFQMQLADQVVHGTTAGLAGPDHRGDPSDPGTVDTAVAIAALELVVADQPWDVASWTRLEELHRRAGNSDEAEDVRRRHAAAQSGFF